MITLKDQLVAIELALDRKPLSGASATPFIRALVELFQDQTDLEQRVLAWHDRGRVPDTRDHLAHDVAKNSIARENEPGTLDARGRLLLFLLDDQIALDGYDFNFIVQFAWDAGITSRQTLAIVQECLLKERALPAS
jgi:hypothetical protein